jgi:NTP pyrophosphatase (non-canonical NTP hydrolase)
MAENLETAQKLKLVPDYSPSFDYLKESERTLSNSWYGDKIDGLNVINAIDDAIEAIKKLDQIKKAVFYGKDNGLLVKNKNESDNQISLDNYLNLTIPGVDICPVLQKDKNLFHAIIGVATEAGELLEALLNAIESRDEKLDLVNIKEEVGDVKWYLAILAREAGFKWGEDEVVNIEKLRKRFPEKFTEEKAENRDLTAERNILEGRSND